jgi:hypothetical protein
MSCIPQNNLNNTNGASGDDGEEWTNVPSRGGSESTTTGAEAPQTTTVLVPKKVAKGALDWAKRNWAGKPGQKAYVKGNSIVLSGGTSKDREKTATVFRKLIQDWAKPKGKQTGGKAAGGKKGGKSPVYFAPADLLFPVVKPLVEAEGFDCLPLGKDGKMSRYGLRGKSQEERDAMAQQVTDHCADIVVVKVSAPFAMAKNALNHVAKELKGIRFTILPSRKEGDMSQYILEGATSEDRDDFAQAVGMTALEMIEEEARTDFYTVPATKAFRALKEALKVQSGPKKWGGFTMKEQVEAYQLKGYTDKTRTVSRYTISGGTETAQAAFVAKVSSLANGWLREDRAKEAADNEADRLLEEEDAEYAKFTNEQRDAESYFEREAARKAAKTVPKPRGSGGGPAYAGSGPAEENSHWLKASNGKKSKQEKQAARAVRAEEKQQREALEKKEAARAAAIKAEEEERKAAQAVALSRAIAATNTYAAAFGSDDEDVEEPSRTPAEEEVTPVVVTQTAPSGAWSKGKPDVKVVEQPVPKGKGKAKAVTFTADTHDDSDCEDWEERSSFYD